MSNFNDAMRRITNFKAGKQIKGYFDVLGDGTENQKGGKRKRRRRGKQRGGNIIKYNDLQEGKTYDVTFSDEFINHPNNHKMSKLISNVLFEKMPQHQEGYFKLKFIHQEDGETEEHILHEGEYGIGKTVYARQESGSRFGVGTGAGGRRKTKKKRKRRKNKKTRRKRRKNKKTRRKKSRK